jgi:hypothetical protein
MSTGELELTTANTKPLPEGHAAAIVANAVSGSDQPAREFNVEPAPVTDNTQMDTSNLQNESALDNGDVLLDLGDMPPTHSVDAEEFVLDIDLDEPAPAGVPSYAGSSIPGFVEPRVSAPTSVDWQLESEPSDLMLNRSTGDLQTPSTTAQMEDTLEWMRHAPAEPREAVAVDSPRKLERVFDEPAPSSEVVEAAARSLSAGDLSSEQIDAIARRAVEMLSEKVVQEIAWEVVPQLAELMIKRKLEEKETQPK